MRESVGGALLLQIVMVFLVVYIGFMAVVIHYGTVFRIKNAVINYIEQNEGIKDCTAYENVLIGLNYNYQEGNKGYSLEFDSTGKGTIYTIELYMSFKLPLTPKDQPPMRIAVRGQTKLITTGDIEKNGLQAECAR